MINYWEGISYRTFEIKRMVRVSIAKFDRVIESNRWFSSIDAVEKYVKYICPKKYGFGQYKYFINK